MMVCNLKSFVHTVFMVLATIYVEQRDIALNLVFELIRTDNLK